MRNARVTFELLKNMQPRIEPITRSIEIKAGPQEIVTRPGPVAQAGERIVLRVSNVRHGVRLWLTMIVEFEIDGQKYCSPMPASVYVPDCGRPTVWLHCPIRAESRNTRFGGHHTIALWGRGYEA